jgi:MFS family permease
LSSPRRPAPINVFSRQGLPIFATFLTWGTGSGAQTLARPLFAYFISGGSIFLVTFLISALAALRMFTGPLTGFLTDHWGRKPMAVTGAFLRGSASFAVLFVDNYAQFFVLEMVGAVGVSMWQTTSQVMVADMSTPENRGKAVAARNTSLRLGQIFGPILGGGIAAIWGLQAVFVINGITKYIVMVVTFRLVAETRPSETSDKRRQIRTSPRGMILKILALRGFTALAITTVAVSLMNQGVFMTLFPIAAQSEAGLNDAQVGSLLSIAGVVTLLASFPNGMFVDRYGRKRSLVAGLLIAAIAGVLLVFVADFQTALIAALVFGLAQAINMGANQAFAMDLAPENERGAFLGVWTLFQSLGAFIGPLMAGAIVEVWGFDAAFYFVAALLVAAALAMAIIGPETRKR